MGLDHHPAPEVPVAARRRVLWRLILAAFVLVSLCSGFLLYTSLRDILAYANVPFLDAVPVFASVPGGEPAPTAPPKQSVAKRVNVLLLGIDEREEARGPSRTDTMIICSVDPVAKTMTMLSIPRDLWLPLPPSFDRISVDRINAAHFWGDYYHYPGGGPALAKETVQYNLGVPIQYYVRVDFSGFVRIVDEIGGIDVDVPRDIVDTAYPVSGDEVTTLRISAGRQHMNGDMALKYARTRHDSDDIDRAHRQQQVMLAVRDKVLDLDIPFTRIPSLLAILGDSVQTDMTLDAMYGVAQAARSVGSDGVRQAVIDETMTTRWFAPSGADVLLPQQDKIRQLVAELFPVSQVASQGNLAPQ